MRVPPPVPPPVVYPPGGVIAPYPHLQHLPPLGPPSNTHSHTQTPATATTKVPTKVTAKAWMSPSLPHSRRHLV